MTTEGQPESRNLAYYINCFSQIQVYKNNKRGGEALNQPILLLSVIDAISQGLITENRIFISDELIDTFKKYWSVLTSDPFKGSDFALPFFHLKNGKYKFWHLQFSSEYDGGRPQTIPKIRKDVDYAYLDQELFNFIQDPNSRKELIDSLINAWFTSSQKAIEEILKINQDLENFSSDDLETTSESDNTEKKKIKFYLKKSVVREAFFRKAVVHLYDYRCAFCRLRVTRSLSQSLVDGAHIKPFAKFYDSNIKNGISLCKNHHWAFDQGWFTIDNNYKIIIAQDLDEDSPYNRDMKEFHGELIFLPNSELNFPRMDSLIWHRQNIFRA